MRRFRPNECSGKLARRASEWFLSSNHSLARRANFAHRCRNRFRPSSWLTVVVVILTLQLTASVDAQIELTRSTDEFVTLDFDNIVVKRLATVEDLIGQQRWAEVATMLRQAQLDQPDKLVPIGPGWYVNVTRYVQCRAAMLPVAGLAEYRRQVDATAQNWLQEANQTSNHAGWQRVVREAFASSSGRAAVVRLAEDAFERGDLASARSSWEKLLPVESALRSSAGIGLLRCPVDSEDCATIRARLVLCSLCAGDMARAERELNAFRRLHGEAIGTLGGRTGILAELLQEQHSKSLKSRSPSAVPSVSPSQTWSVTVPPAIWQNGELNDQSKISSESSDLFPVIADNTIFVTNGESIFAWDLLTGQPKWSEGTVAENDVNAAVIYSLADSIAPKWPIIGRPQNTLTIHGERLFARLGTPVTGRASQERNAASELVALDIGSAEGKLVWRVTAEQIPSQDLPNEVAPWCFEGSPAVDDRHIYVALRRSLPQEQINVACFDADTARLLWNRKVAITVGATEELLNSTSHLRLTLTDDSVFISTDSGAIAALDNECGSIRWLRTYRSEAAISRDRRRDGSSPPLFRDGVVFVAPLDTNQLIAIHAESGLRLWERDWSDPVQHVIGISGTTLLVQGRSLWGVNVETGEMAWPNRQVGFDDPEGFSAGRGVIVGETVYWPTRDELFVIEVGSGKIARRIPLKALSGELGGHLSTSGSTIVLSRDSHIVALGTLFHR